LSTFTNVDAQTVIITSDQVIAPSGISCDGQILVSFDNDHNNQNSYSWRRASDDTPIASPDGKDLRVNVCGGETYILSVTNGCTEEEYTFEVPTCDEHFVADMNAALSVSSNVHSSDLRPDFITIEAYIISDASQFEVMFDDYLGQPLPTKRLFNNGGNVYTFTIPAFVEGGQGGPLLPEIPVRGLLPYRIVNSNGCSFSGLVEIPDCSDRFIWTNRGNHEF
jgi:hypothetical protein